MSQNFVVTQKLYFGEKVIVLDCDGVLLNYNAAYPGVWMRAFNEPLNVINPKAYHAAAEYGATFETPDHKLKFYENFGEEAWSTMPPFEGVVEACNTLSKAGYVLVCVSSMPPEFAEARQKNFDNLGLPIEAVIATGRVAGRNPKLEVVELIKPVAFVDDLLDNFHGITAPMHKALVDYGQEDSPNRSLDMSLADSHHKSFKAFVDFFL